MLIVDGQGLSPDNRVPPAFLAGLMAKVKLVEKLATLLMRPLAANW